ncbi:MAG: MFS transporter [Clostridia bacterium]|nr:MFS transporter [Clostridia bacterium]
MTKTKYFFPLTLLCSLAYFASYLTRINYQVLISAISEAESVDKSTASLAITALFITYGLGQLLAGMLGDRIDPRVLIFGGLTFSVAINFILPSMPDVTSMTLLWGFNGLCRAMIWPPVVKICSSNLNDREYEKAVFWVNASAMIANVSMYLISPALISRAGAGAWRTVFYVCASAAGAIAVVFFVVIMRLKINVGIEKKKAEDPDGQAVNKTPSVKLWDIIPFVIISMAFQGLLRDGITTWTPNYLKETFSLDVAKSILLTVLLPISSIVFYRLSALALRKLGGNEPFACTVMYGALAAFALLLLLTGSVSPILSAVFLMLCTGLTHAINYVLVCIAPNRFKGNRVASIAGLFNFSVYLGSAASTFGFASLAESKGWSFTIGTWVAIAFLGALCCAAIVKKWRTRLMK